ncbi:hypothetical protein FM119_02510 [Mycetocola reblochoni REB411]|uniref:Uncharacterized protein n=1 Tax=Mycetocola reblochoni REB411 TaxID=1255698 RepID=A0A1R4IM52_9MICO|nr:hypothetical protein FM119_02510 [Mycetocola reblochoni REB411]
MLSPAAQWSTTEHLLANAVDMLQLIWRAVLGKKAQKRLGKFVPIERPGDREKKRGRLAGALSMDLDEVKRRLALPRRG